MEKEGIILVNGAFGRLLKFPLLAAIPIVVDGFSVLLGILMNGFHGSPHVTYKLTLQMGLPSISAVTEQRFMPGSVQVAGGFNSASAAGILLYLVLFLIVQSFLQAGYVGLLYDAGNGRMLSMKRFASYGRRFFARFLLLDLLVLVFLFALGGLATAILKMPGIILFIIVFLLLRVQFLFLEYTMLADDCSIVDAFSRSRAVFRRRTHVTLPLVGLALGVNVLAGLLVNALWMPLFFFVLLVLYDIVSAGLQLAFMNDFLRIR